MSQKKPDPKADQDESLDEQALEEVSGGARATGAAGEAAAINATRKKNTSGGGGGRSDLDDLQVER